MDKSSSQSGNVFFLILAAVAMFAALSWAFTQGSRQSGSALTAEQNRMAAQEIIAYGNTLADTVQKLKLRGCMDTQLDFSNTNWTEYPSTITFPTNHNPNAPASGCGAFKSGEGNLQANIFPLSYVTNDPVAGNITPGTSTIRTIAMPGIGTAEGDLIYDLPRVTDDVCLKINSILNISETTIPSLGVIVTGKYAGDYSTSPIMTDPGNTFTGKSALCGKDAQRNRFLVVLLAR